MPILYLLWHIPNYYANSNLTTLSTRSPTPALPLLPPTRPTGHLIHSSSSSNTTTRCHLIRTTRPHRIQVTAEEEAGTLTNPRLTTSPTSRRKARDPLTLPTTADQSRRIGSSSFPSLTLAGRATRRITMLARPISLPEGKRPLPPPSPSPTPIGQRERRLLPVQPRF